MNKVVQGALAGIALSILSYVAASSSVGSPIDAWWIITSAVAGGAAIMVFLSTLAQWVAVGR